jgi:hypothetical protein
MRLTGVLTPMRPGPGHSEHFWAILRAVVPENHIRA